MLGIKKLGAAAPAVLVLVVVFSGIVPSAAVAQYDVESGNAVDWLIKSVCVDAANRPVAVDPYYECPAGTTWRKIQVGDPLPYYNHDQEHALRADAYPILDANGDTLYIHSVDGRPFGEFQLYDASDGFDFLTIRDGWVSAPGTRDGGGYGQQFFGSGCSYGNGWIFFPSSGFLSGGQVQMPIAGSWWEQVLLSYPGVCRSDYSYPLTAWGLQRGVSFGGVNGNPIKVMDAMVAYHGFEPGKPSGMEVFYSTQQYGYRTRWEHWVPQSQNPVKTTRCVVPDTVSFLGVTMVVDDCRDWTTVELATEATIPQWPLPPANLLKHSHFDDAGGYTEAGSDSTMGLWRRGGKSAEGNIINWGLRNSTSARDTRGQFAGVRYLQVNCGGTCTGPRVQQILQEIPIDSFTNGGTYLFGAFARTAPGNGQGTLQITLQELDAYDNVLWQDYVDGSVTAYNGTVNDQNFTDSVYLSSAFIHKTTVIPILPGATKIRYYLTPITPQAFDVLDTFLNPFPAMRTTLGSVPQPTTVSLDANGQSALAIYAGDQYALNWNSINVTSCSLVSESIDGTRYTYGIVPNSAGSSITGLIGSYTFNCTGTNGQNESKTVRISQLNNDPVGTLDGISPLGLLHGWTFDPDASARSIAAHVYVDGPYGAGGQFIADVSADQPRPDVNTALGISGDHGFSWQIPAQYVSGAHTWYVYGIDSTGGHNPLLAGSPASSVVSNGIIQGYKILSGSDTSNVPVAIANQPVSAEGVFTGTTNPYSYSLTTGRSYTMSVPALPGYSIGYTLCIDSTTCHTSVPTPGNSVPVNLPAGSGHYADLWWHYTSNATDAPTATLTANGSKEITVNVGDPINYAWTSTNAIVATSSFTVDIPDTCNSGSGPFPWVASTLSGTSSASDSTIYSCQAAHTYTITYTVTGSNNQIASDSIVLHVGAAPVLIPMSPDGSSITPSSNASLKTVHGTWTFSSMTSAGGNTTLLNGQANGAAKLLIAALGGRVFALNTENTWFQWVGSQWNPLTLSGDRTTLAPGTTGYILTSQGIWSFSQSARVGGNLVLLNGKSASNGAAVLLVSAKGSLFARNNSGAWSQWTGSAWIASSDPVSSTFNLTATPNPCIFVSGASTCSSTISWTIPSGVTAQVWVRTPGGAPTHFACNTGPTSVTKPAPWIIAQGYTFALYRTATCAASDVTGKSPDATLVVTGKSGTTAGLPYSQTASILAAIESILKQLSFLVGQ